MVYLDTWNKQYLSYLVVDYSKDEYEKEVFRRTSVNFKKIEKYGFKKENKLLKYS